MNQAYKIFGNEIKRCYEKIDSFGKDEAEEEQRANFLL